MHQPVPAEEIFSRIYRFQRELQEQGVELALIRHNADLYYFTGTVQDGHLLVPSQGHPVFLVWRIFEHAREQSPLENIFHLKSLRDLPQHLQKWDMASPCTLGLEMDVLPAGLFLHYSQEVWPKAQIKDITHLIRKTKSIKSQWEISQIKQACRQVKEVMDDVPDLFLPGMSCLDLSARIECELRKKGHPGYIRMRSWNQELGMGQVLAGPDGALPSWTNTPAGGPGTSFAYGIGAGPAKIKRGDPVSVDLGGCFNGYYCDQTRLFTFGTPSRFIDATYGKLLRILEAVEQMLSPGVICQDIYQMAVQKAEEFGLGEWFMGTHSDKVGFIGHGLGVEIDEYPFIAKKSRMPLEPGMVLALEPKLLIPDIGLVGVEDTYLITEEGWERLTLSPRSMTTLS